MIGASSARAARSAHGFRRENHRVVFAPRSPGTFLSLSLRDLDLDDLFLSLHSFTTHLNGSVDGILSGRISSSQWASCLSSATC